MKKIIFIIAILNLLINTSCFLGKATQIDLPDAPDWFFHYENSGFIHGISGSSIRKGNDKSKYRLIAYALWEIQNELYHKKKDSNHNDNLFSYGKNTQVRSTVFGNIKLEGRLETFLDDEDLSGVFIEGYKHILKLSYIKEGKSLIFVDTREDIGLDDDFEEKDRFDIMKEDFSVDDLLKELEDYGFNYEFEKRKEEIFLLMEIDRELLLSKQNIDHVSNDNKILDQTNRDKQSDIKLDASKAQKKLQEDLNKYNLKQNNN